MSDITDAAGVPKGSFYNYFQSKEDFALAVLEQYREQAQDIDVRTSWRDRHRRSRRLRKFFEEGRVKALADGFSGGCLAGRLAQELAGEQPSFRPVLDSPPGFRLHAGRRRPAAAGSRRSKARFATGPRPPPSWRASSARSWQGAGDPRQGRRPRWGPCGSSKVMVFDHPLPSLAPRFIQIVPSSVTSSICVTL